MSQAPPRANLWFLLFLVLIVAGVFAYRSLERHTSSLPVSPAFGHASGGNVRSIYLKIDPENGKVQVLFIPWSAGMTVQTLLQQARVQDPAIQFEIERSGESAFLTSLLGISNDHSSGKFWQYEINGQYADKSLGIQELQPGDRVLWKFADEEYTKEP